MNLLVLIASAIAGIIPGFSLLYLYWRFCFVHYTYKTYNGPRHFWTELFGEGAYPISESKSE